MSVAMHEGEIPVDADLVQSMVADQFPAYAGLPISAVRSTGTVNAIFRLGERHYARLPRKSDWSDDLDREAHWLPRLAPHLSLRVPTPIAVGRPTAAYPQRWAIYEWIDGRPYDDERVGDEEEAAETLATFLTELRCIDTAGAPRAGRRPLPELDDVTREAIAASSGVIDADAALQVWERELETPLWSGPPVWIHTDLLRPNLLVDDGRITAVIDFGGAGVGDPAADVIAAWAVFGAAGRARFRAVLDIDDHTWSRARGWALHQAAMIIPYYATTNPGFVTLAQRTVEEILADSSTGAGQRTSLGGRSCNGHGTHT